MDLLIRGGHLVSGERADVLINNGLIVELRARPPARDEVMDAVGREDGVRDAAARVDGVTGAAARADEVIDAHGLVVAPGFVDGHRHVWQAPLRGLGADMTLPDYLDVVQGRILPGISPRDARAATLLGAAEALDAGITTLFDYCNVSLTPEHTDAVVDAYTSAGIRAVVAHANPHDERDVRRVAALRGRVTGALAILGADYGPWDEAIQQIELGRRLGVTVSMHAGGGLRSPLRRMYEAGVLGPALHLVHLNQMTAEDATMLVDTGAGVTVTPVVEGAMGHGASAFTRFAAAGGRAGLGTDVAVNAPADLFEPMRDTVRSHRAETGRMHPAGDILAAATVDSARAVGLGGHVGELAAGRRADLVLLDGLGPLLGTGDLAGAVVTTLGAADVHTVVVDGRVVKRDGRLVGLDLRELRQAAGLGALTARAPAPR